MSGTPSDNYQAGLANTKGTWELLKDFVTFVSPSLSSAAQKRNAIKSLNDNIGEWAKEAKDTSGRWRQPFLSRDKLQAHLLRKKGRLQPTGECEASFAWAQLLYALNIRPGDGTLEWKPALPKNNPDTIGTISLAIEGEALCDIINLYQRYIASSINRKDEYRFSFGTLKLQDESSQSFSFESTSYEALKAVHKPFQHRLQVEDGLREGHLTFQQPVAIEAGVIVEEAAAIEAYLNALDIGVSDGAARLESGKKPLQDRVKCLLRAMKLLDTGKQDNEEWDKPYLVTPTWIKEASSIKRRVTTDGGLDKLLVDHIYEYIFQNPNIVSKFRTRFETDEVLEGQLRKSVASYCMFETDSFSFSWNIDALRGSKKDTLKGRVGEELPGAVASLADQPEGCWTWDLSQKLTPEDILGILALSHEMLNRPVIVLQNQPKDWEFIAQIQG